jgi:hypothetical protein
MEHVTTCGTADARDLSHQGNRLAAASAWDTPVGLIFSDGLRRKTCTRSDSRRLHRRSTKSYSAARHVTKQAVMREFPFRVDVAAEVARIATAQTRDPPRASRPPRPARSASRERRNDDARPDGVVRLPVAGARLQSRLKDCDETDGRKRNPTLGRPELHAADTRQRVRTLGMSRQLPRCHQHRLRGSRQPPSSSTESSHRKHDTERTGTPDSLGRFPAEGWCVCRSVALSWRPQSALLRSRCQTEARPGAFMKTSESECRLPR